MLKKIGLFVVSSIIVLLLVGYVGIAVPLRVSITPVE